MPSQERGDSRFAIEADLTPAKIDNLLPGWTKPAGQAGRATFTLVNKTPGTRFEDIVVEAPNTSVKGAVEVDASGEVAVRKLPRLQPCPTATRLPSKPIVARRHAARYDARRASMTAAASSSRR